MYKVVLVDDERIILEGIASVIDWGECGTQLVGKAVNGRQAMELLEQHRPHIVITDMKMAEMNGMELIQAAKARYPDIYFIVLSGHEHFLFAQTAMQYGIKHYLLKPCSEEKILKVLSEVVQELKEAEEKEAVVRNVRSNLEKMLPIMKEQFLKESITNKTYGPREWEIYSQLLNVNIDDTPVRLLLFQTDGECEFEHLFALRNIAGELIEQAGYRVHLSTTIGENVLLLVEEHTLEDWLNVVPAIKEVYVKYYKIDFTAAISSSGNIQHIRRLYKETKECLSRRFYIGEGSIITSLDIDMEPSGNEDIVLHDERLTLGIRSGNLEEAEQSLKDLFAQLRGCTHLHVNAVKAHVQAAYLLIVRQTSGREMEAYFKQMIYFHQVDTLDAMEGFLMATLKEVTMNHYATNAKTQSQIVQRVIRYVEQHLDDETLSLTKLSKEIFYLNSDYLGKLFRKETGEKFTNYLLHTRMKQAQLLLDAEENPKIIEIASKVGFGNNPQYFSQVFKRHTGSTPTEYKKRA
jgi:two-component system response regulator YesN